jgi:hypothetical protein
MIEIRELARGELARAYDIDDSDDGDVLYVVTGACLATTPLAWHRPTRTPERWDQFIASWERILDQGGAVYGALREDLLIGVAVFRPRLTTGRAQLQSLFVSRAYRRRGWHGGSWERSSVAPSLAEHASSTSPPCPPCLQSASTSPKAFEWLKKSIGTYSPRNPRMCTWSNRNEDRRLDS